MPTWITARRLGVTAVLYAVFVGGWFLGQPLAYVGCDTPEPVYVAEGPDRIAEPGEVIDELAGTVRVIAATDFVSTTTFLDCDATPRPRIVAWVLGDWR